jgi:hypothetical protein
VCLIRPNYNLTVVFDQRALRLLDSLSTKDSSRSLYRCAAYVSFALLLLMCRQRDTPSPKRATIVADLLGVPDIDCLLFSGVWFAWHETHNMKAQTPLKKS